METEHIGGDFDDFLRDERLLDDAEAAAAKRVIAYQIAQEMKRSHLTKSEMAHRMNTSRPALESARSSRSNWRSGWPNTQLAGLRA
jgi:hypothetical protein